MITEINMKHFVHLKINFTISYLKNNSIDAQKND